MPRRRRCSTRSRARARRSASGARAVLITGSGAGVLFGRGRRRQRAARPTIRGEATLCGADPQLQPAAARRWPSCRCRWSPRCSGPAAGDRLLASRSRPISASPARPPISSRRSSTSGWCPTAARSGCCRGWSARRAATEMMMLGERMPADEGARLGPDPPASSPTTRSMREAFALAERLAAGPTVALWR